MQIRIERAVDTYPHDLPEGFSLMPSHGGTDAVLVGAVADVAEMRRALLRIYSMGYQMLSVSPV